MYISILTERNNHGVRFLLSPLCKEVHECGQLYRISLKPQSSSEGLAHSQGCSALSTSLRESAAQRQLAAAAGGDCPVGSDSGFALPFFQVRVLRQIRKEVLIQRLVPYTCFKLWIPKW